MALLNITTYVSLLVDSNQTLWAGTSSDGLVVIENNGKKIHYLNAEMKGAHNLKSNAIREIRETQSGIIWIATKFEGLHFYDKRQNNFTLINEATSLIPGLSHEYVLCTYEDTKNNIWIGTKSGGLTQWNRTTNTFTHYKHNPLQKNSIGCNRIEMITADANGNLWIAHDLGLDCLAPGSKTFVHYLNFHIRNLCLSKTTGYLWLGTSNGIFKFDITTRKLVNHPTIYTEIFNKENNLDVSRIFEDRSGTLWIGTGQEGLFQYDQINDQLTIYTHNADSTSISGNMVRAIYQDSSGNIWVGTKSDGFNRFNKKEHNFTRFINPNPQSSNTVYQILEDPAGNLWMGTHKGIERFSPADNSFVTFNTNYGLQSLIFDANAFGYTHDGLIMLGGSKGLNLFDPLKVKYQEMNAPMIVTSVFVDNKKLARDLQTTQNLIVPPNVSTLSFEFALLDYTSPDENTYAYQLEDFDKDWIYADTRNFASYTNLPSGNYTFKVKGANNEGVWSEQTIQLHVCVKAPFWRAWWFIAMIVVAAGCLILLIFRFRIRMIQRNEIKLKEQVRQQTATLSEAYDKLEKVNHEIEVRNKELLFQSKKIRTQNTELEQHHQNLEKQVNERTRDLAMAKLKAEESDQLKSAFLANMSHEIRTPLNAIIGFTDLITTDNLTTQEREYMNRIIQSNSLALLQLINDIVDISLIEANQLPISITQFNLGVFMTDIANDAKSNKILLERGLTLYLEIQDHLEDKMLNSAPERINQIFNNLINNAIKFTDEGSITIGCQEGTTPNNYLFYVRDTGCGIIKSNQEAIFERFRKIEDSASRLYRGTGIGLSICRHICQLLGGKIWVESQPDKGSTFFFSIPDKPLEVQPNAKASGGTQKINYPDWSGKTILIAEDEDSNFEVLRYSLLRTHINIIRANHGSDAIEQLNDADRVLPDLILMDIRMPVMDGIEASAIIKKNFPNIPVIAQTGYAAPLDPAEMKRAGFDAFITKPIATRKLLEKMLLLMK